MEGDFEKVRPRKPPKGLGRLDRPMLSLLVNPDDQRPWSERELARELLAAQERLTDTLEDLHDAGLIHRYSGLVSATHAAVRMYEIEEAANPVTASERSLEETILALLLAHPASDTPLTERDVIEHLGEDRSFDVINAFDNLYGIGLIDRSQAVVQATQAARRYSELTG